MKDMVQFFRSTSCILALLAPTQLWAAPAPAHAEGADAKARTKVLLLPPGVVGEVRPVLEKRIAKSLQDSLAFAAHLELLTDRDRAEKAAPDKQKVVQVKGTATSRRIDEADLWRQEGTDLAAEGKQAAALDKLRAAIAAYEKSYIELVDYTKLADAYARGGIEAFSAPNGAAEAQRLFENGIALQPTLVIDRRKQPKELLALFDSVHERLEKQKHLTVTVEGNVPGAEVFIDGVKVGPLPARKGDLLPGRHYVQVRGETWQPWGKPVDLKNKDAVVAAKPLPIKVAAAAAVQADLTVAALADCVKQGAFQAEVCKGPGQRLAKQTGADYLVFAAIKADRYGRLAVHPFVMDGQTGATISLKPLEFAADLADLNAKASGIEADVEAAVHPFDKAKALTKPAAVFREGAK